MNNKCTFFADKNGKHLQEGDTLKITIQNHPSMTPVELTKKVTEVNCEGFKVSGSDTLHMFNDRSNDQYEIL